jgi:hypothetical protein
MNQYDHAVRQLIADELSEHYSSFEAAEEKAAGRLAEAIAALVLPEQELARIDEEIERAQAHLGDWETQLNDSWLETRVEANKYVSAYQDEITRLEQKRTQATEAIQVFYDERNAASKAVELAQDAKLGMAVQLAHPYGEVGRGTSAYAAFRMRAGGLIPILLSGDTTHPEFKVAWEFMDEICERSGYRTEGRIPSDAEKCKESWDRIYDQHQPQEAAPSMGQVMAEDIRTLENVGLMERSKKANEVVEDYRTPVRSGRDYMKLPGR